jgi:hypothetical protein
MSAARYIRSAFTCALREAGQEVVLHYLTYPADDPMDDSPAVTETVYNIQGLVGRETRGLEPVEVGTQGRVVVTVAVDKLPSRPTKGDRVVLSGSDWNIADVRDVQGALYQLVLAGEAPAAAIAAPVVAARFSATSTTGIITGFTYASTINITAYHRVRYRTPLNTGPWQTNAWSVSAGTTGNGTVTGLAALRYYNVQIQGKDTSGNVGDWHEMDVVLTLPNLE